MKIVTWNVNSLTARWARVSAWIGQHEPDIVLIQETKQNDTKFPFDGFRELGYESAHHGQGQWNGVAIVSRVGIEKVAYGLDGDEEARLIGATCGDVRVYSAYVPNGRSLDNPHYQYKLGWLRDVATTLQADPADKLLIGGDFNIAPTDEDCWDPAVFEGATHVSTPERDALTRIMDTGLIDLARVTTPEGAAYTWWDYRNGSFRRGWGLRIDLLLARPALASSLVRCVVDRDERKGEKPSDHAPLVAEFS